MARKRRIYRKPEAQPEAPFRPFTVDSTTSTVDYPPEALNPPLEALKAPLEAQEEPTLPFLNKRSNNKPFRLSARRLYLTYSQVHPKMSHKDVYESLSKVLDIFEHAISKQSHADGGIHFHAFLVAKERNKFDVKSAHMLDLEYKGKAYHGRYETVKSIVQCIEYVCRQGDYETNLKNIVSGKVIHYRDLFAMKAVKEGVDSAKHWFMMTYPAETLNGMCDKLTRVYYQRINLERKLQLAQKTPAFQSLDDYNLPEPIHRWIDNDFQPPLMIEGPGGIGKTNFTLISDPKGQQRSKQITSQGK